MPVPVDVAHREPEGGVTFDRLRRQIGAREGVRRAEIAIALTEHDRVRERPVFTLGESPEVVRAVDDGGIARGDPGRRELADAVEFPDVLRRARGSEG